jgi:hypothetical protein
MRTVGQECHRRNAQVTVGQAGQYIQQEILPTSPNTRSKTEKQKQPGGCFFGAALLLLMDYQLNLP